MTRIVIFAALLCSLMGSGRCAASLRDEIPDFEFDDNFPTQQKPTPQKESSFSFDDFDDLFIDDGSEPEFDIVTKEKIVHRSLLKALAAKELKYKFSEVLPLLRALSKSQRMVFASIISAQINGGKSLTLEEVKEQFGLTNSKPLLLPIVFDLANLVREGFLKSDKYQEHEKGDKNQFLRRSFDVAENPKKTDRVVKEIDFSAPSNLMKEETLQVEDDEPTIRNIEKLEDIKAEPLMQILNSSIHSVTTHKPTLSFTLNNPLINLTREEIEDLALSGLNGSVYGSLKDANGTDLSPMALVGRHRKKTPFNPGPHPESCERFTGGLCLNVKNYPMNDIMGSIRRHRHAMEALLAEYRDKTAESEQLDYLGDPTADLSDLRRRQDNNQGTSTPGSMCSSIIRYARPQKARSATGEWKFIVNTGEHTQTLRLEKCSQPLEPCAYLTENFESSCTQVYNYHRLLSWDNTRGLHVDIFKVPTCCSCHLMGYKEAFPPLASPTNNHLSFPTSKRIRPQDLDAFSGASSNRNAQYSALDEVDDEFEEDEDSANIAYQFGNGFKRLKPKKENLDPPKNRLSNRRVPTFPDTFLTPPENSRNTNTQFKNRGPSNRQRTPPIRRKQYDQSASESDLKISRVTINPQKPGQRGFSQSERPRRVTPSITSTIDTNSVNLRLPNAHQNPDVKRINYNYHPIIDFFEDEEPRRSSIERKSGRLTATTEDSWRPMVGG